MNPQEMDRRDFHHLMLAALGGTVVGASAGCNNGGGADPSKSSQNTTAKGTTSDNQIVLSASAEALIMDEPHVCRGLNSCEGKGRDGKNACAGQGTCANIADSTCGQHNACKGQGGCGANPGMNDCKGQGGCSIPLMSGAWETARAAFEFAMKKHNKPFGVAPAKN